ncbi:hypothetical protein TIFTF001_046379 [Ficus carica]|uniref:Uncharacterized protein n=1 Tax=Ficus carica TaxID=3494 RepID=A0AA88CSG6_FICCA|nr:hypothetical protein TIFTF001_046379 [Ficus carica]
MASWWAKAKAKVKAKAKTKVPKRSYLIRSSAPIRRSGVAGSGWLWVRTDTDRDNSYSKLGLSLPLLPDQASDWAQNVDPKNLVNFKEMTGGSRPSSEVEDLGLGGGGRGCWCRHWRARTRPGTGAGDEGDVVVVLAALLGGASGGGTEEIHGPCTKEIGSSKVAISSCATD